MVESVNLNLDSDGFISQECPKCGKGFKIDPNTGTDGPIQYCPYCKHMGSDCWWTKEQAAYIVELVERSAAADLFSALQDACSGSSSMKVTAEPPRPTPTAPQETESDWPIVEFPSKVRIKHDGTHAEIHCPVTGVAKLA